MTASFAIVIPTRDRADLAIAAIRALSAIGDERLGWIIVSNNSSDPGHVRRLADYCAKSKEPRLVHLRPERPLGMADHWDWAIGQALALTDATHLALHYDRRVSYPDLPLLFDAAETRPDVPVTHLLDVVVPYGSRFFLRQMPWTGGIYEIRTKRALELASRGKLTDLWMSFPVLVNGVTPRSVFERILSRFGNHCASTSPESCFGFRYCAVGDSYLHLDRALGVHYGLSRSNGMGYAKGDGSAAFADFMRLHGDRPWLDAAPIPGLNLGQNSFYHEFAQAGRDSGGIFPPIEMNGYLDDLARCLSLIVDPVRRSEARSRLVDHGWSGETEVAPLATRQWRQPTRLEELRADHWRVSETDAALIGLKSERRAVGFAVGNRGTPVCDPSSIEALEPRLRQCGPYRGFRPLLE